MSVFDLALIVKHLIVKQWHIHRINKAANNKTGKPFSQSSAYVQNQEQEQKHTVKQFWQVISHRPYYKFGLEQRFTQQTPKPFILNIILCLVQLKWELSFISQC